MSDYKAHVLFVDDEPDRLSGVRGLLSSHGVTADAIEPQDLESDDLDQADLVSVDQYLGPRWLDYLESLDGAPSVAGKPADGLAVAAALASQLRVRGTQAAVTLHTAEIEKLGAGLFSSFLEPLLAGAYDLDWVFRFDGSASQVLAQRMAYLAQAMQSLPSSWDRRSLDFGTEWLLLPSDVGWREAAVAQVEDCRPPAHGLAENSGGRAIVRWLAQRILPYPAFLLDDVHASTLLGTAVSGIDQLQEAGALSEARYSGPLATFMGRRWWRAGLQNLLLEADVDEADEPIDRSRALGSWAGVEMPVLDLVRPVVTYGADGLQLVMPIERAAAVRLQPDGWPVFADDAWASVDAVRVDDSLASLVVHDERVRLGLR